MAELTRPARMVSGRAAEVMVLAGGWRVVDGDLLADRGCVTGVVGHCGDQGVYAVSQPGGVEVERLRSLRQLPGVGEVGRIDAQVVGLQVRAGDRDGYRGGIADGRVLHR